GPDPRNFNQRVSLGRNDLLIRTFPKESSVRGRLKHKLWWNGFLPGRTVYQSRYFSDPFMRVLYS
ncbi:hypothetical protein PCJ27_24640, partial [Klebsiella pneumoniae]|nr:hypothetical protein [Klebsiella pneumoniae]